MSDLSKLIKIAEERDDAELRKVIVNMQKTDDLLRRIAERKPWWQRLAGGRR